MSLEYTLAGQHVAEAVQIAIADWKPNTIRLPVKDAYWLGRNPVKKTKGRPVGSSSPKR